MIVNDLSISKHIKNHENEQILMSITAFQMLKFGSAVGGHVVQFSHFIGESVRPRNMQQTKLESRANNQSLSFQSRFLSPVTYS